VKAVNVVDYLKLIGGGDPLNSSARDNYVGYIESHMRTGTPIQFVILGFPCKSTNIGKKVLWPGSKMKCNALECLLKIQAQKGVANEKVPSINSMGKNKDSDVKAIGVLINEDCRSA
jgi:hypothetical protein